MTRPPKIKDASRRVTRPLFLKTVLCVVISLLAGKTIIDLSRHDTTALDLRQIDAASAAAYQKLLKEANVELFEGPLHEPSDPNRICQADSPNPVGFSGTATLKLRDHISVELTISDCHPCRWPVKPSEDIPAYALLDVKSSDNLSFSIESYVGGDGERSSGTFRVLLPTHEGKRLRILKMIRQIGEYGATPNRAEFNDVLTKLLASAHNSIAESEALRLGTLLCRSVDASLNTN